MQLRSFALLLVVAACGGSLATLPTGPKPAWVNAPAEGGYPDADFMTGVGMAVVQGGDLEAAQKAVDAQARVELIKKIEVSVSSEFTSLQSETSKDGVSSSSQSVSDMTREAVQGFELEGVEVKARWLDEASGVAYAVAVWPKARAEALLKAKLNEAEAAAKKAEAEGDAAAASNPGTALKQYVTAVDLLDRAQKNAVLLRAVMNRPGDVPSPARARAKLDKLLEGVEVVAAEGNGQRAKAQAGLPQPLVVKATANGAALIGLPLSFELAGGALDTSVETDTQGLAKSRVTSVGALASGEAKALARVDWGKLAGGAAWTRALRPLEAPFVIVSKSLSSTRVLIKIIERIEEAAGQSTGSIQSALSNQFSSTGFGVRDGEALTARIPAEQLLTLDPKAFQKEARDLADLVVVGEAVSSFSSTLSGDVVIHRARLNLRVVDLGTGEVIATINTEKKGQPGKGPEKAGKKALEALAAGLDVGISAQVQAKLGL